MTLIKKRAFTLSILTIFGLGEKGRDYEQNGMPFIIKLLAKEVQHLKVYLIQDLGWNDKEKGREKKNETGKTMRKEKL